MQCEVPLHRDENRNEIITQLILEYSEDMLILAYTLTHNAIRANRIVENILLHIYLQNKLMEHDASLHTWLYSLVKKACEANTIQTK